MSLGTILFVPLKMANELRLQHQIQPSPSAGAPVELLRSGHEQCNEVFLTLACGAEPEDRGTAPCKEFELEPISVETG